MGTSDKKIYRIEIITRPERLEDLKDALRAVRVTGMTVSQVYVCGLSTGFREVYRGQAVEVNLLPKVKVEIVACEIDPDIIIEAATKACHTGQIGDGKIFVTEVADAVRIRTGERGPAAIMDRQEESAIVDKRVSGNYKD